MKWLATMPSTNALVLTVIGMVLLTTARAMLGYPIPDGWYAFVLGFATVALVQFMGKRMTHKKNGNGGNGA